MHRYAANFNRRSGVVELSSNFVRFVADDGSENYEILAPHLRIGIGGSNRALVQLSSQNAPQEIISSTHTEILDSLKNLGYSQADEKIRQVRSKKSSRLTLLAVTAGFLIVLLVGIPMIAAFLPSTFIDKIISRDRERALIKTLPASFFGPAPEIPPKALDQKIGRLVFWLQEHSESLQQVPIEVMVSPGADVNAFAYPGDLIVVNDGLIRASDDLEMLAGVIAHELGHIERRHNLKAIGSSLSLLTGAALLSLIIGTDGAAFLIHGAQFSSLKYSRDHEREADEAAVEILARAGLSPDGLLRFFEKLKEKEVIGSSTALNVFSTHPMTDERISRLKAKSRPSDPNIQLPITLPEIKESLDP